MFVPLLSSLAISGVQAGSQVGLLDATNVTMAVPACAAPSNALQAGPCRLVRPLLSSQERRNEAPAYVRVEVELIVATDCLTTMCSRWRLIVLEDRSNVHGRRRLASTTRQLRPPSLVRSWRWQCSWRSVVHHCAPAAPATRVDLEAGLAPWIPCLINITWVQSVKRWRLSPVPCPLPLWGLPSSARSNQRSR